MIPAMACGMGSTRDGHPGVLPSSQGRRHAGRGWAGVDTRWGQFVDRWQRVRGQLAGMDPAHPEALESVAGCCALIQCHLLIHRWHMALGDSRAGTAMGWSQGAESRSVTAVPSFAVACADGGAVWTTTSTGLCPWLHQGISILLLLPTRSPAGSWHRDWLVPAAGPGTSAGGHMYLAHTGVTSRLDTRVMGMGGLVGWSLPTPINAPVSPMSLLFLPSCHQRTLDPLGSA